MSDTKEIYEMATTICRSRGSCLAKDGEGCGNCLQSEWCLYQDIARALYREEYRKQSEWISVDERLPEKEQIVLCCLGLVMNVYTYKGDRIWEDSYGYWQKDEPITHWMPLPEPPKGE